MQAKNNSNPSPLFVQSNDAAALAALILAELGEPSGRTTIELCAAPAPLTPKAALTLAMRACEYLLTGEPAPQTFDPEDLEQAIPLLQQMAATVKPAGR